MVVQINRREANASTRFLQAIHDTALQLTLQPQAFGSSATSETIGYSTLNTVAVYRKGSIGRGAWMGALSGGLVGGAIGAASYGSCTSFCVINNAGTAFFAGALVGLLPGLLIGIGVGTRKQKFRIRYQKEAFTQMRSSLLRMKH